MIPRHPPESPSSLFFGGHHHLQFDWSSTGQAVPAHSQLEPSRCPKPCPVPAPGALGSRQYSPDPWDKTHHVCHLPDITHQYSGSWWPCPKYFHRHFWGIVMSICIYVYTMHTCVYIHTYHTMPYHTKAYHTGITLHYITLHWVTWHSITPHTYLHTYIHACIHTYIQT